MTSQIRILNLPTLSILYKGALTLWIDLIWWVVDVIVIRILINVLKEMLVSILDMPAKVHTYSNTQESEEHHELKQFLSCLKPETKEKLMKQILVN